MKAAQTALSELFPNCLGNCFYSGCRLQTIRVYSQVEHRFLPLHRPLQALLVAVLVPLVTGLTVQRGFR